MNSLFNLDYLSQQLQNKVIANTTKDRLQRFMGTLNQPVVDLKELRSLAKQGVPDDLKGLRSLVWKLLIGYLPPDRSKWKAAVEINHETYEQFCKDLIQQKQKDFKDEMPSPDKQDHPLSKEGRSSWKSFFDDQVIWEEVEKDTIRTRAELSFFVSPTQLANKFPVYFRTQCRRERIQQKDFEHRHFDVLTRILFIYAKLNPGIRYVQGMNEILAPFYYTFYSDVNETFLSTVESDSFFCFTTFMSDAKESFIRQMDQSQDGILAKINQLDQYLRKEDWEVWNNLQKQGICPQFYSLRWIMLYLTQEFELHGVFRLWDSLLSQRNRNEFMIFACLGILKEIRRNLLQNDFTDIMEAFKIQELDVDIILQHADQIYQKYQQ